MGAYNAIQVDYDIQYKRHGQECAAGSGSFGEVRPCTHMGTHKLRAVKTIDKKDWNTRGHVMQEIAVLQAVSGKHPNIIEFVEYYEEWSVMNLIFEFCPFGSLEDSIQKQVVAASESSAAPLLWQVLRALTFLRDEGIVHRDVKPSNLLFADESTLKLADFGSAAFGSEPLVRAEGTPCFFAPEVHQLPRGNGYSFPVDMWAAGVTLYMLMFKGTHPFNEGKGIDKQLLCGGHFSTGWLTSSSARDLLEWLLMPNPDQRIQPSEALKHPWFGLHGLGDASFTMKKPRKLVLDSRGNWLPAP
mmetsp:Transcript_99037/g.251418  ORF Transcript_99037/g.251418 Transcript_99037/m.251418 type:complete len:301 (-) Transcript_99037:93-995(-)